MSTLKSSHLLTQRNKLSPPSLSLNL
jgi:hypothetical protein